MTRLRFLIAATSILILTGCSAARSSSPLSHPDPASPDAEEAPVQPLPSLMAGVEPVAATTRPAEDHSGQMPESHQHHQEPAKPSPAEPGTPPLPDTEYVCPMHPHVKQPRAGSCPICGMKLEQRRKPSPEENS